MSRILVFGDSIAYGAWDKQGGWVQRLRQFLDDKNLSDLGDFPNLIYNLGISGNTSQDLLERFEFEASQRSKDGEDEMIILFAIGSCDSDFVHSRNDFWVLPEKFEENIKKLIIFAQKFSLKIVFVGHTPADELRVCPMPWDKDKSSKNENIQRYNQIIKQVCAKNNVYFIEIFENWIKIDYKKLLEDGLHPNSEGHQKIFEAVKNFLIENKVIKV